LEILKFLSEFCQEKFGVSVENLQLSVPSSLLTYDDAVY